MLSSLSSFLPQSLQIGANNAANNANVGGNHPHNVGNTPTSSPSTRIEHGNGEQQPLADSPSADKSTMGVDEQGSFIVVRPPPAKNNHPLNLQVQLVPPSSKEQRSLSSRRSFDSSVDADESGVSLSRTTSNRSEVSRSDVSVVSGNTSVTSFSTVASSSSTTSTRRMIIPLYNLQAHNVLTNVIVDAGTDAKVARFQKRGLEIVGLAVLEPIEVWEGASYDSGNRTPPRPSSFLIPGDQHTPTSSAVSLASDVPSSYAHDHLPQPTSVPSSSATPQADRNGPRKFFGKIFNKRKPTDGATSPTSTPRATKRSSLLSATTFGLASPAPASPLPQTHIQQASSSSTNAKEAESASQVLGIQPILASPHIPPKGRHPKSYVWVVRKWLKGGGDGLLDRLSDRSQTPGVLAQVEVRFEWTRAKNKRIRERSQTMDRRRENQRRGTADTTGSSEAPSLASSGAHGGPEKDLSEQKRKFRLSREGTSAVGRRSVSRSRSPNRPASTRTTSTDEGKRKGGKRGEYELDDDDSGNESDPEDSETPWTCTMFLKHLTTSPPPAHPYPNSPTAIQSPTTAVSPTDQIKVKVGAVVPTPHHPKVVALLKVPFPLPDIEVEQALVRKRVVTPAGVARPTGTLPLSPNANANANAKSGLVLTAEEIKDIVSCTGLWIVVREGFGGVGKERRKGDGWRIRG
ncbi:hypothetical protein BXZ70DRAFT_898338 [Cristinia sonorae]|uniref:Uncharacterized protein n=1 Tax=Cristinia sonorae TaxID=1940300 RepID=A0A8K0UIV4_9AGAR|nr:hypothetical protein BXZ70DRAFT_898338 [Cristinia sonorae]